MPRKFIGHQRARNKKRFVKVSGVVDKSTRSRSKKERIRYQKKLTFEAGWKDEKHRYEQSAAT